MFSATVFFLQHMKVQADKCRQNELVENIPRHSGRCKINEAWRAGQQHFQQLEIGTSSRYPHSRKAAAQASSSGAQRRLMLSADAVASSALPVRLLPPSILRLRSARRGARSTSGCRSNAAALSRPPAARLRLLCSHSSCVVPACRSTRYCRVARAA